MKMGSFIIGSLVGMAGAIYLSNRSPSTVRAVTSMFSDVRNSKMMNGLSRSKGEKQMSASNAKHAKSEHKHSGANKNESKQMIQEIIESDPKLQQQFNEIKNEASSVQH